MEKFILYLGLNDKDTKVQKIDTAKAHEICEHILLHYTAGGTVSEVKGIYTHNDGTSIIENTLKIELLFTTEDTVKLLAEKLKEVFNQESIAVQKQPIDSYLV